MTGWACLAGAVTSIVLSVAKGKIGEASDAALRGLAAVCCVAGVAMMAALTGELDGLTVEALGGWSLTAFAASQVTWWLPIKGGKWLVDKLGDMELPGGDR